MSRPRHTPLPERADAKASRGWTGGRKSYHRWLKRAANRLWRRLARRDPEDAPRQPRYRGWET